MSIDRTYGDERHRSHQDFIWDLINETWHAAKRGRRTREMNRAHDALETFIERLHIEIMDLAARIEKGDNSKPARLRDRLQAAMAMGHRELANRLTQQMVDEARGVAPKSQDEEGEL